MLQRGARGPQSWEEQRGEPLGRLEAPDAPSAMPPAQGQPAARAGGGLPPPGGSQGDWWDPSVPAEEAEGQAPDADELLQDFLEDPDVMDGYLSKAAAEQKGTLLAKRALQPGKAGAFLPSAEEAGLGAFAARLERELEQTARDEGLEIRERFQPRAAPDVGPARSGERSVRSILEELDALEAAPSTAPAR